jgi:hypothetical protein
MPFSQEAGYTPATIETIMISIMNEINTQFGTSYTYETFVGTNFYKYFYALAQRLQENEVKTSEIFLKLQQYITLMNERISRPVVTSPGVVEKLGVEGYIASVKPMIEADAGKIHVCVDADDGIHARGLVTITNFANLVSGTDDSITVGATVFTAQVGAATPGAGTFQAATSNSTTATSLAAQINAHATAGALVKARAVGAKVEIMAIAGGTAGNSIALVYTNNDANVGATVSGATLSGGDDNEDYADIKEAICTLLSEITVAGAVTQGTESESIVLSNGQSFDFKYNLPNRIQVGLKLTITLSENNQVVIGNPDGTKSKLLENIATKYRLGRNFEPQKYFTVVDAPWASQVLLEYTTDVINDDVEPGASYSSAVFDADYDDLFEVALERVELVEA